MLEKLGQGVCGMYRAVAVFFFFFLINYLSLLKIKCRENADSARKVTYCILTPRNLILSAAPTDVDPLRKHGELVLTKKVVDDS